MILSVDSIDTYYGEAQILFDVSLDLDEGEVVSLLGRNGAGKTTTLRSIMGLTPPRSGTITFDGEEIQGLSPEAIYGRGIGFIKEDRGIFPDLTVRENLQVGMDSDQNFADAVEPTFEYFPRLEERLNQRAGTMSGGEQQMLTIARTLVSNPKLLLIDEPVEGLMPGLVDTMRDIIVRLNEEGHTILLVEQNIEMALEISDRAYVLSNGRIRYDGDADELVADDAVLDQYLSV